MVFLVADTLRERIRRALTDQAGPMTAAQLAALLLPPDLDSARRQAHRALAQLESAGHVVRRHGQWSAAQPSALVR
jgi:predicted Zn-ribbon and HTH transcriptional regulator